MMPPSRCHTLPPPAAETGTLSITVALAASAASRSTPEVGTGTATRWAFPRKSRPSYHHAPQPSGAFAATSGTMWPRSTSAASSCRVWGL